MAGFLWTVSVIWDGWGLGVSILQPWGAFGTLGRALGGPVGLLWEVLLLQGGVLSLIWLRERVPQLALGFVGF